MHAEIKRTYQTAVVPSNIKAIRNCNWFNSHERPFYANPKFMKNPILTSIFLPSRIIEVKISQNSLCILLPLFYALILILL